MMVPPAREHFTIGPLVMLAPGFSQPTVCGLPSPPERSRFFSRPRPCIDLFKALISPFFESEFVPMLPKIMGPEFLLPL